MNLARPALPLLLWVFCLVRAPGAESADATLKEALQAQAEVRAALARISGSFVFVGGGSGVCISPDGYILTSNHVVARQPRWVVRVHGWNRLAMAEVVGRDPQGDIALLKIPEASGLPFATLAGLAAERPGRKVLALGDPFKLGDHDGPPSASLGTLCAVHRYLGDSQHKALQTFYADALQTDAAVNPGNSGGPLFSLEGELLGLTGQIVARHGGKSNSGIAYAVPASQLERFLPLLKAARGGTVFHGTLPTGLKLLFSATAAPGAEIEKVERGSPAWQAGFRSGDRVLAAGQEPVTGPFRLLGIAQSRPEDTVLGFELERDGKKLRLSARLPRLELPGGKDSSPAGTKAASHGSTAADPKAGTRESGR